MYMIAHYKSPITNSYNRYLTTMIFDNLIHNSNESIQSTQNLIYLLESQLEKARQELAEKQQDYQVKLTAQSAGDTALTVLQDAMQKVFAAFGQHGIDEMCEKILDIASATLNAPANPLILTAATDSDSDPAPAPEIAPTAPTSEAIDEVIITPVDEATDAIFQPTSHIIITDNPTAPTDTIGQVPTELPRPTDEELSSMPLATLYKYGEQYGIWLRHADVLRFTIKKYLMGNYYLNPDKILPLPAIAAVPEMKRHEVLPYAEQCGFTIRAVDKMRSDLIREIRAQESYQRFKRQVADKVAS